jgi:hypothetical protein
MNYSSGNGRIIPTTSSPDQFDNDAPTIVFPPPPPDTPNPNKVSHPHMAVQHGKEIFVPDLVCLDVACYNAHSLLRHRALT